MAGFDPITAALDLGGKIIDKIFPDPAQRDAAKLKLLELQQNGDLAKMQADTELAKGQIEVNKVEAAGEGFFKSGWRPSVGWVCSAGLGYEFIGRPLLVWVSPMLNLPGVPPDLAMGDLMTLLFGMLGLGSLRTYEKTKA